MTRLFTAALATETNTFSPLPVDMEGFREQLLARFVTMEQALFSMNNTLDTIRQQMDVLTADN